MNKFRLTQHELFYRGIKLFGKDMRLLKLYSISLLSPEIRYYKNGILINPTKLFMNKRETTMICSETSKSKDLEETKGTEDDEFIISTISKPKIDKDDLPPESFFPRNIPTCHFIRPNEANNIFMEMRKDRTCFVMIKSDNFHDVQVAISVGLWSSTAYGNISLSKIYQDYVKDNKGNAYLFF